MYFISSRIPRILHVSSEMYNVKCPYFKTICYLLCANYGRYMYTVHINERHIKKSKIEDDFPNYNKENQNL